jgi:uncharacterized damage-inducible protein DinB
MDAIAQIRDDLRRSVHGPAWHGPALLELLAGVSPDEAGERPVADGHTIAELVLHAVAWIEEVDRRLRGAEAALPARGDWPAVAALDAEGWASLREELRIAAGRLDETLAGLAPERLHDRVGGPAHDPPLGSGVRLDAMLRGLAHHNAYHGGQVAVLKRALPPRSGR